jgi:hypothetical protein
MVDPVVAWIARLALAGMFAAAAHHKWRDPGAFAAALTAHRLVPEAWVHALARGLALAETAVAVGLVWPAGAAVAGSAAGALLALYSAAIAINLARGRSEIDCGCSARPQRLSGALLVRNAALGAAVWPAIAPASQRALVWVDALSGVAGLGALALVWLAAQALAFGAPAARLGRTT